MKSQFTISAIIILYTLFGLPLAVAIEVTHLISPGATFTTTVTGRSCSTFVPTRETLQCNSALPSLHLNSSVQMNVIGKAEGSSIETGKNLIFEPITEIQLRKLFNQNSFNSFGFNSNISFITPLFRITYTPYLILGDIAIYNPSFPEVAVNLVKRSNLSFSSAGNYADFFGVDTMDIFLGQNINYYTQIKANTLFSLLELTTTPSKQLLKFEKSKNVNLDLSTLINFKNFYELKLSAQLKNILSKETTDETRRNSSTRLETLYLFEPYGQLGIGKSFKGEFGNLEFNIESFFMSYYKEIDPAMITLGASYSLGLFTLMGAYSKNYQSLGMYFLSQNFDVGVAYILEKNADNYQSSPEKSVYLGLDVNL